MPGTQKMAWTKNTKVASDFGAGDGDQAFHARIFEVAKEKFGHDLADTAFDTGNSAFSGHFWCLRECK